MLWAVIAQLVQVILDERSPGLVGDTDKDLEPLVLHQQIRATLTDQNGLDAVSGTQDERRCW